MSTDDGAMNRRDSLLAALVAVLWGFNFVVIDWGMGDLPPLLFAAIRFVLVAFPACLLVPRPRVSWRVLVAVGAFMSLGQFGFLYVSMHAGMPPGLAALVLQSQVVFTIVIAVVALRERTSVGQVTGVGLGVAGLVVVALGRDGHVGLGALLLCLLAGLSWGIGNVVARAARVPGGLGLAVWSAVVVPVPLLLLSLLLDGPHAIGTGLAAVGWHAVLSTAYTVVMSTMVGFGIFNGLLARHPSGRVVPWVLLVPVVAMMCAWALVGEQPGPAELVGAALLVLGVLVAQGVVALRPAGPTGYTPIPRRERVPAPPRPVER
jgi:O-acetylserine/cysteine efflux transporter